MIDKALKNEADLTKSQIKKYTIKQMSYLKNLLEIDMVKKKVIQ